MTAPNSHPDANNSWLEKSGCPAKRFNSVRVGGEIRLYARGPGSKDAD